MTSNRKEKVQVSNHFSTYLPHNHHTQNFYTEQMTHNKERTQVQCLGSMHNVELTKALSSFWKSLASCRMFLSTKHVAGQRDILTRFTITG